MNHATLLRGVPPEIGTTSNVYCERVSFVNCPTSFQTDPKCLQCGLFECTIFYDLKTGGDDPVPVTDQTMVILNGSMDFVTGCVIGQQPVTDMNPGPADCTGIALLGSNNGRFITDTHLTDFLMRRLWIVFALL
jgi:hypothetical protein